MGWNTSNTLVNLTSAIKKGGGVDPALEAKVDALETTVGDSSGGLVKDVSDIETAIEDVYPDAYSTTEVKVGTYNGEDLYRRVFHMTSVPVGTNSIETGITRTSITPRNCYGFMRIEKSDWDSRFVPFYDDASKNVKVQLVERSSEWRIFVTAATSYNDYVCDIVLEYTKNATNNTRKKGGK